MWDDDPIFHTIQQYTALDKKSIQYLQQYLETATVGQTKLTTLLSIGKLEIFEWKRGMVLGSSDEDSRSHCSSRPFVNVKLSLRLPCNTSKTHVAELSPSQFQVGFNISS